MLKVYTDNEGLSLMIYDHANELACWGEAYYYCYFPDIKEHWTYVGGF